MISGMSLARIHFILRIVPLIFFLAACKIGKTSFGGSETPNDYRKVAARLIASSDLFYSTDATSIILSSGQIDAILNTAPNSGYTPGTMDLLPDAANIGTYSSDWMVLQPTGTDRKFRSPIGASLDFQSMSAIILVRGSSRGTLLSVDPLDETTEAFSLRQSNSVVTGRFTSSTGSSYESTLPTPTGLTSLVAVSFGADSDNLLFTVNGALASSVTLTGAANAPNLLTRYVALGPNAVSDTTHVKRMYLFSRALSKTELGSMILYLADQEGVGDINLDPSLKIVDASSDPNFAVVKSLMGSRCNSCHAAWSGASASYFANQGLIVKGNPEASPLYYRLSGSTGGSGPKTMPLSGSLSAGEVEAFRNWILKAP